jgi:4'-phosphopantetheinyl transferase
VVVEVHFFSLDVDPARFVALLTPDERERAARFRFDVHRNRYVVCRGRLRELLGADQPFLYGAHGKPYWEGEIAFNVSHSHDVGMIAIGRGIELGCDVERVDPKFVDDQIPERFFSPGEVRALRALPKPEQTAAFFRIWTRKEAVIKACGLGVSMGLDTFDVTLDEPARILRGAAGLTLKSVEAPDGFMAAVAARGEFTVKQ